MKRSVNLSRQRKPPKVSELARALEMCGIGPKDARKLLEQQGKASSSGTAPAQVSGVAEAGHSPTVNGEHVR